MGLIIGGGLMNSGIFPGYEVSPIMRATLVGNDGFLGYIDENNQLAQVDTPVVGASYIDSSFLNDSTGYAVAQSGEVVKTVNGGLSWTLASSLTIGGSGNIRSIEVAPGGNVFVGGQTGGTETAIWKSSDGGSTFDLVYSFTTATRPVESFSFLDSLTGYSVDLVNWLETTDGGDNWSVKLNGTPLSFNDEVGMASSSIGWAAQESPTNNFIHKTTDGWTTKTNVQLSGDTNGMYVESETQAWMCGEDAYLYETTDGTNWSATQVGDTSTRYYAIHFDDTLSLGGMVGDNSSVYITENSGSTWSQINVETTGMTFNSIVIKQ